MDYSEIVSNVITYLGDKGEVVFNERVEGWPDGSRKVFRIDDESINDLSVYVDSEEQVLNTDYTYTEAKGLITFVEAPAINSDIFVNYVSYKYDRDYIELAAIRGVDYVSNATGETISVASSALIHMLEIATIVELIENDVLVPSLSKPSYSELGTRISNTNLVRDRVDIVKITRERLDKLVRLYLENNIDDILIETANMLDSLEYNE